jgi:hypothetical protein
MLKKNLFIIFGIILLGSLAFTNSYTPPTYNQINMTLCDEYTPPTYNQINFTLGDNDDCGGDTCTCPSINTNWEINMSHYCNLTTNCDLGTGNLTFTDTGWCNVSATIETKTGFNLANNQIVYINGTGVILIG